MRPLFNDPIYAGQVIKVVVEFFVDNELTDPTTVYGEQALKTVVPTPFTYPHAQIERVSQGIYRFSYPVSEGGLWVIGAYGTGAAAGGWQAEFEGVDLFAREEE